MLEELNPAQAQAVTAPEGPLLIIAGPGSGKTRVISHRAAYLARQRNNHPQAVLAVTFTNKAAKEMEERIQTLLQDGGNGNGSIRPETATFHSWCAALLRRQGALLGLAPNYSIIGDDERETAVKHCLEQHGYDPGRYGPRTMADAISNAKNRLESPENILAGANNEYRHVTARIYRAYEELLRRNNSTDLDGLITQSATLLEAFPHILADARQKCRHLIIDEFQDANAAQYRLARLLAGPEESLCAVGDPDQSIYSWRGAAPENFDSFIRDFPQAKTINLERNYRSTPDILNAAKGLIGRNPNIKNPNLSHTQPAGTPPARNRRPNPDQEAEAIIQETLRLSKQEGISPGQCAVLIRTNRQAAPIIEACRRNNLEHRTPDPDKSKHRKALEELAAYLKAAANPRDGLSLEKIINTPPRGIGPRTIAKLRDLCQNAEKSLPEALEAVQKAHEAAKPCPAGLRPQCAAAAARFSRSLSKLIHAAACLPASQAIAAAAEAAGPGHDQDTARDLAEIAEAFDSMPPPTGTQEFLERTALLSPQDAFKPEQNSLNILTLHQAKGLEFEAVFMPGMEEGLLPHYRALESKKEIEEERRLCFVGITRAKQKLYLSWCARRQNAQGEWANSRPSRFLSEIPLERAGAKNRPQEQGPKRGDRIWHPRLGQGTIIHAAGGRNAARITARFNGKGARTILVRLPKPRNH